MNAKLDRGIFAVMFVCIWVLSLILYFFVQDKATQLGILAIIIFASGGIGFSLARMIQRR